MGETVAEKPRAPLDVSAVSRRIIANVEQVIVGKRSQIVQALVAWYCEGHVLLEDVPGVAKTIMARALAKSAGCTFKRIQCTPDLLPTDVSGGSIFNQKSGEFQFRAGPLFCATGAGRRDQPGDAPHAERALGSDGRGIGDDRRRDASAQAAVSAHRHAEPDRP